MDYKSASPAGYRGSGRDWDYKVSTWSEAQAERYLLGLRDALAVLMDQPELGRARNDVHPGLMVSTYSKHLIFYLREEWGIDVVRVLHGSHDIPAHFKTSRAPGMASPAPPSVQSSGTAGTSTAITA